MEDMWEKHSGGRAEARFTLCSLHFVTPHHPPVHQMGDAHHPPVHQMELQSYTGAL